jgi:8-amino-7-oxononanoate synthase
MNEKLLKKLRNREEKGTLRSLSSFDGMIDLISNDYLGFASFSSELSKQSESGATGSRLISGNRKRTEELESAISRKFGFENGLFFNSGYDANLGVFSSIPQRGDVVLYDEFVHASIRDGIRLSFAESFSFRHNDLSHLEERLENCSADNIYIAIEGLYSMNGDLCPIEEINRLALKYSAKIILDEAHSAGVLGDSGRGVLDDPNDYNAVMLKLVTFGKAFGSHGAIVLSSDNSLRSYLINFARSFIYTTALPLQGYEKVLAILESELFMERRAQLKAIISKFDQLFPGHDSNTPIKILDGYSVSELREIEQKASESNLALKAIFSPTVPEGQECIRVTLHAFNTDADLALLKGILVK